MQTKVIKQAHLVSTFLMELSKTFCDRWNKVAQESGVPYPFGDLAYGEAIVHWRECGESKDAWFSYALTEMEDPFLIEFAEELFKEFGLPIFDKVGGERRRLQSNKPVLNHDVYDWGPN